MTDKIKKNKCEILIKQIFGSNFYFVHGTSYHNIEPILKSGYIKTSPEIDKKYWRWEEGSLITIDDVLFATRVLCADDTRRIEKFTIIKCNDPNKLILKPTIDNFST